MIGQCALRKPIKYNKEDGSWCDTYRDLRDPLDQHASVLGYRMEEGLPSDQGVGYVGVVLEEGVKMVVQEGRCEAGVGTMQIRSEIRCSINVDVNCN